MKTRSALAALMFCVSCTAPGSRPSEINIVECEIVDYDAPVEELRVELDENRWLNKWVRLKVGDQYKNIMLASIYGKAALPDPSSDTPHAGPLVEVAEFKNLENGKTFRIVVGINSSGIFSNDPKFLRWQ